MQGAHIIENAASIEQVYIYKEAASTTFGESCLVLEGLARRAAGPSAGGVWRNEWQTREWPTTMSSTDSEVLAQEVSALNAKVASLGQRMAEVEKVNSRLEQAALTTARALQEISGHWDAVYEAMRRTETDGSEATKKP